MWPVASVGVVGAPLMADQEWEVRNAAKDLGILDWGLCFLGAGASLGSELNEVLAKAFLEGGPRMVDAAVERSGTAQVPLGPRSSVTPCRQCPSGCCIEAAPIRG